MQIPQTKMADARKELQIVISARDEASKTISGFTDSFKKMSKDATIGATAVLATFSLISKRAIETGIDFEQARISFETFLGSGEKAGNLLKDLSDFAVNTPFNLPQVIEGAKSLLAYGVASESVVDTFGMLGDLSSGNAEKLGRLTLAFGQVKAATRLTGAELRQFHEAGIPLLETLAKQYGVTASAATEMISEKQVSFDDVRKALKTLTSEGGLYFNNMGNSAKALGGVLSNVSDEVTRFTLSILGFTQKGEIREGSIFFHLKKGAVALQGALQTMRPQIEAFVDKILKNKPALMAIAGVFIGLGLAIVAAAAPIILATAGLIAFGAAIGFFIGALMERGPQFIELFKVVGMVIEAVVNNIKISLLTAANDISTKFGAIRDTVVNIFTDIGTRIKETLALSAEDWAFFWGLITGTLINKGQQFAKDWGFFWAGIRIAYKQSTEQMGKDWNFFWAGVSQSLKENGERTKSDWQFFLTGLKERLTEWKKTAGLLWSSFLTEFKRLADSAFPNIQSAWNNMWTSMRNGVEKAIKDIIGFIDRLLDKVGSVISKFKEGVKLGIKFPSFQHGGFVDAPYGQAVPAILHGGERVVPRNGVEGGGGNGGGAVTINFSGPVSMDSPDRVDELAQRIARILGRQNELASKGLAF